MPIWASSIERRQLGEVLGDPETYPADREQFILDMMRRFELCFAFPDSDGQQLLIPELLRPNEPELNWEEADALNFQYHYTALPGGIMPGHSFPRYLGRKLRTTNVIERLFVEVRRRTRPMVCFVNVKSVGRIIYSLFHRFNREWENAPSKLLHKLLDITFRRLSVLPCMLLWHNVRTDKL